MWKNRRKHWKNRPFHPGLNKKNKGIHAENRANLQTKHSGTPTENLENITKILKQYNIQPKTTKIYKQSKPTEKY
jgi:hypothetical protein